MMIQQKRGCFESTFAKSAETSSFEGCFLAVFSAHFRLKHYISSIYKNNGLYFMLQSLVF